MNRVPCYIGLGSNLGDSKQILIDAVHALQQFGVVRVSRLYRSLPMGPQDQPDYFNAVVALETTLAPLALLDELQNIEQQAGRVRLRHWGERTLDLDLLLYGVHQIQHERLIVPHYGLLERDFVILPLLDLDPELSVQQQKLSDLDCIKNATAQPIIDNDWLKLFNS